MKDIEHEQLLIRKYLLGELNEEQRQQLEQRVITNPEFKEEVLITEEELLEDFVSGTLSSQDRELFLRSYSSPAQLRKVEVAKALAKYAAIHPIPPRPAPSETGWTKSLFRFFFKGDRFGQLALATATIVLIGAGGLIAYWRISRDTRANYAALLQLNGPDGKVSPPDNSIVVSVNLSSLLRQEDGKPKTVTINTQTETVQFRLADPSGGAHVFRAVLKNREGAKVFDLESLPSRKLDQLSVLILQIPAKMLSSQEYQLEISEKVPGGEYENPSIYSFQVRAGP